MHFTTIQYAFLARFSRNVQHTKQRTLFARAALRAQINQSNARGKGNKALRRLAASRVVNAFHSLTLSIR